jgi:hypothetical protein
MVSKRGGAVQSKDGVLYCITSQSLSPRRNAHNKRQFTYTGTYRAESDRQALRRAALHQQRGHVQGHAALFVARRKEVRVEEVYKLLQRRLLRGTQRAAPTNTVPRGP